MKWSNPCIYESNIIFLEPPYSRNMNTSTASAINQNQSILYSSMHLEQQSYIDFLSSVSFRTPSHPHLYLFSSHSIHLALFMQSMHELWSWKLAFHNPSSRSTGSAEKD